MDTQKSPEGYEWIWTTYIHTRDGKKITARSRGKKAFRILVKKQN